MLRASAPSRSPASSTPGATPQTILPMKFKPWRSALLLNSASRFWSIQDEKTTNKQTLGRYQIGGDDDVIE